MTKVTFKACAIVPVYRHAATVPAVVRRLVALGLPCILVNDGSDSTDTARLRELTAGMADVTLLEQFPNRGKGAAVLKGMRHAVSEGYTHALQVDADGQHCLDDAPRMLTAARRQPHALITGVPLYDQSVPRHRLISRYITHFWVWVETLSFQIRDSMCGYRVYPLAACIDLTRRVHLGWRMEFDTQIMVRLYWRGVPVVSVPTRVTYPRDGISTFRLWRDNVRITWMHTRLFFGMLPRAPLLLWRRRRRPTVEAQHS